MQAENHSPGSGRKRMKPANYFQTSVLYYENETIILLHTALPKHGRQAMRAEGQPPADEGTGESISAPAEPVLPAPAGTEGSGSPEPAEPAPVQAGEQTPSGTEPAVTEPSQPSDPEHVPPPAQDDGSAGIRMF